MMGSHFSFTLRKLYRNKLYTFINVAGLAVALSTCFFIYSWVRYETSFDTQFKDGDHIFRIETHWDDVPDEGFATTYPMVKSRLLDQVPEIVASTRLYNTGFLGSKTEIHFEEKVNTNSVLYYADSTFFQVFAFPFVQGDEHALRLPNSVVITKKLALVLFGDENPIGKVITIGSSQELVITGVIYDIPSNTHFNFDLVASMQAHPWIAQAEKSVWSGIAFNTYVKLHPGSSSTSIENKLTNLLDHFPNDPEGYGKELDLKLQRISSIHLHSNLKFELLPNGNMVNIYLFITIAILVLIVAIINYINLATASHAERFKEVGVRKVMGANRSQLILQFYSESFFVSILSTGVALILIELVRPRLLSYSNFNEFLQHPYSREVVLFFLAIPIFLALLSGIIPAIILSGLQPLKLFKPALVTNQNPLPLRKILVVFQFAVSIVLTVCTIITVQQIRFINNQNMGYDREQVVLLNIGYQGLQGKYTLLKSALSESTHIAGITASSQLPSNIQTAENIDIPGRDPIGVNYVSVDPDFFTVLNIDISKGKSLLQSVTPNDSIHFFAMNRSTLKKIGWDENEALSNKISIRHGNQRPGDVIGIVEDFHFQTLHHAINPLVFEFTPAQYQFLLIKIKSGHIPQALTAIQETWEKVAGTLPFEYSFLDDAFNSLYKQEQLTGSLFSAFTGIAFLIALLGLFGLSSFAVTKRMKEISIRKILGAKLLGIFILLVKDFGYLLLISLLMALPIGYFFQKSWLSNFAYQADISAWVFIGAITINFILALLTIGYHCVRASNVNPVDTLRNE